MTERNKLIQHTKEVVEGKPCPICGNKRWYIGESLLSLNLADSEGSVDVACAKCTNCGFTALFSEV